MSAPRIQLDDLDAWESLRPGQFVVFLSDPRTDVVLDRDTVPVFDLFLEAEIYAEQTVNRMPSVCAAIYYHQGRSGDPLRRIYHPSIRKRFDPERSARWYAWTGGGFLLAFAVWAVFALSTDERFLWLYLLGLKLFTVGTVLFVRGIAFFIGRLGGRGQK